MPPLNQSRTSQTPSNALVCHLRETTPDEAIKTLQRAGILAIPGAVENSIVLVGFHYEIRNLLRDFRLYGYPRRSARTYGKLHKLSLAI
jgi:CBS domain-containing protein